MDVRAIRTKLTRWYDRAKRDLPWRRTRDPYAIWISEIMLQQTRVTAVIPYYERFLRRFPDAAALAQAPEQELLAMWSGLGYYSRARNLQKAARQIIELGAFPHDYASLRELAGVGEYTAAAIASIAFGLPHAVVDGNVRRVIARLMYDGRVNDGRANPQESADRLLDRRDPAQWNQAVMELGATVCLPREPLCYQCPVVIHCAAHRAGTQGDVPLKRARPVPVRLKRTLLLIRRNGRILLAPSARVKGFWDLPEPFRAARLGATLGEFAHTITHRHYRFTVREAKTKRIPATHRWHSEKQMRAIPLSTVAKKALELKFEEEANSMPNPIPKGYHTVTPYLVVSDAAKLIDFLKRAFGATERYKMQGPDGAVGHAEMQIGDSVVMLGQQSNHAKATRSMLYIYGPDCDALYRSAIAAGATSVREPVDQFYGDRNGAVSDFAGNEWWIATHKEDVSSEEMERRMAAARANA